ncbi:acyl-CoA thioester hydrolase [Halobacillus alkaliphilus]|uniref:Acyl-CoA thioester hydrolase n=1 Tax=Halobacillus alkaliphilus TaxID=396056 RepID=A0A1I2JSM7_9BACI|nr:thioesterase family protein [Halobacillus alkaliphilus]SFF57118.1 acyl-CoA thioester hydrolase [Halobacillus alkaliphilus]
MKPSFLYCKSVPAEWVDYNGYMNDAEYSRAFSLATDAFIEHIVLDEAARTMKNQAGDLVATLEEMLMGIDQTEGRGASFPGPVADTIHEIYQAQDNGEYIKQAGRTIGIGRK